MSLKYELPSNDELAKLNLHSLVAYSLRCALRVLPFLTNLDNPQSSYKKAIIQLKHDFQTLIYATDNPTIASNLFSAAKAVKSCDDLPPSNSICDQFQGLFSGMGSPFDCTINHPIEAVIHAAIVANASSSSHAVTVNDSCITAREMMMSALYDATISDDESDSDISSDFFAVNYGILMSESASAAARRDYVLLRDLKAKITDASETGPLGDLWHDFPLAKWYSGIRENYPKTIAEWENELAED